MSDVDDLDPLAAHDAAWDAQRRQWFDHEVRHQKTYEPDNDDGRPNGQAAPPPGWTPTVIDVGEDFEPIPPRGWLLGATFCREFVSSVLAAGATGKTALRIAQLLSLASHRSLTGEHVFQRGRVMLFGLEDGIHELRRRVRAAMIHYGIQHEDIAGWFYIAALPPEGGRLVSNGAAPLKDWIEREIAEKQLDLVCFDPLIKTHDLEENDNNAIERVIGTLVSMSINHRIAVDAPHHVAKGTSDPGNADKGRGASSFKDGGRLVYTLNTMSEEEAKQFGIADDARRRYIRLDAGKVNLAASNKTRWFELIGVSIGNGTELYPAGDEMQVAVTWKPPDAWAGLSSIALNAALTDIDAGMETGERFSGAASAGKRAAWPIVQRHNPDKTETQCREIVRTWMRNDVLVEKPYDDPVQRKELKGLCLNPAKRPS
jgi:hypothetical protein